MDEHEREAQRALHQQRRAAAQSIAELLGETDEEPKRTIYRIVKKLGIEGGQHYAQKALEIEAGGGMMLADQSRRRSLGGVFFYLVKTEAPPLTVQHIFQRRPLQQRTKQEEPEKTSTTSSPKVASAASPFKWEDRLTLLAELQSAEERGETKSVKVTLIGRPGRVVDRGQCVVTTMHQSVKMPALPKGLPVPAPDQIDPTLFAVYIAAKQWKSVAEAIKDPEDVLIVEGVQLLDKQLPGTIAVFAMNVTTKKTQAAKKQSQSQKT